MCGRSRQTVQPQALASAVGFDSNIPLRRSHQYIPRENAHPGNATPVAYKTNAGSCALRPMRWGLVPSFTKKGEKPNFFRMFNARSETAAEKPSFRRLVGRRGGVVAFTGFYEWKQDEKGERQPYYFHYQDDRPMLMATLYDTWEQGDGGAGEAGRGAAGGAENGWKDEKGAAAAAAAVAEVDEETEVEDKGGRLLFSYAVLTTSSVPRLRWLHERMPVLLGKEDAQRWLNCKSVKDSIAFLENHASYDGEDLVWHPVSNKMNNMRYEERDCSAKIELKPNKPPAAITSFFKKVAPEAGAAGAATAAIAAATVTIDTKSPMATAEIPAKRSSSSAPKRDFNKKEKEKELKVMSLWQNDGGTDATPAVEGSTGTSARIDGGGGGDEKMAILDHGKEQQERGKDSQERCVAQAQPLSLPSPPQEAGEDGTGSGDGGGGNSGGSPLPLDLTPEEMEFVYGKGHGLIAAQSSPSGKAAVTAEGSGGDDSPKSPTSGMKKRPAAPAAKASSRSNNSSSKRQGSPSVSRSKTRKKNNDDNNQPTLASFFQRSS